MVFGHATRWMNNPKAYQIDTEEGYDSEGNCRYTIEEVNTDYGDIPVQVLLF